MLKLRRPPCFSQLCAAQRASSAAPGGPMACSASREAEAGRVSASRAGGHAPRTGERVARKSASRACFCVTSPSLCHVILFLCRTAGRSDSRSSSRLRHGSGPGHVRWSRAAQVPDRISDPQILDSFRFPGFPQQRSLSGGKQRRNSTADERLPICCISTTPSPRV